MQGPERVKGFYALGSIIDHGARLTLGSYLPVEDLNPLSAFYAGITRVSPDGTCLHGPGGWCVSLTRSLPAPLLRQYWRIAHELFFMFLHRHKVYTISEYHVHAQCAWGP